MADGSVVMRSVLDVDGKSFDVILSDSCLSWGHVGIEEFGLGKKSCSNVYNHRQCTYRKKFLIIRTDQFIALQNCISKKYNTARLSYEYKPFTLWKKVTRFRRHWS